jgi:hypothetical protein
MSFEDYAFHGDRYLKEVVDFLITDCERFIETGCYEGSSIYYVATQKTDIEILSCEPNDDFYRKSVSNISGLKNIKLKNILSQELLVELKKEADFKTKTMFWLDAHGYGFEWPLRQEVEFITSNYENYIIMIDDFKHPRNSNFKFDTYNNQVCSYQYIKESIKGDCIVQVPSYREKTSNVHPLVGWCIITNNKDNIKNCPNVEEF